MKSQGLRVSHGQGEGLTAHSPCHPSASPVLRTRACRRLQVSLAQLAPGVEATLFPELWGGSRLGPCWAGRPWFPGNPDPAPGTSDHGCSSSAHRSYPRALPPQAGRMEGRFSPSRPRPRGRVAHRSPRLRPPEQARNSVRGFQPHLLRVPHGVSGFTGLSLQPPPSETRGLLTCLLERCACPSSSLHLDNIRSHL